jgi:hypothetical protein
MSVLDGDAVICCNCSSVHLLVMTSIVHEGDASGKASRKKGRVWPAE